MFQTFDVTSDPTQGPPRLKALRAAMADAGLDAFIVPRHDRFQGEYVAPCDARLGWLTGFTGSAGFCIATADEAGVFVDGRYRVQVRSEVAEVFTPVNWPEVQPGDWLTEHFPGGGTVGFDPWLHTVNGVTDLRERLGGTGLTLKPVANLVDPIWTDRPAAPGVPFFAQPDDLAGESHAEKRARLAVPLAKAGTRACILTQPDSIAWLLNIRGGDTERNPVPQAFAMLMDDAGVILFCLPGQADGLGDHLGTAITVRHFDDFEAAIADIGGPVQIDPASAPQAVGDIIAQHGLKRVDAADPCALPKARKNATELDGARAAHLRDGAAMVRFLAWIDAEAPRGGLTEISVVQALEGFRRDTNALRDISFETISGAGSDGAIVHYRVNEATDRPVKPGELLLVDSGGQYADGTTDITRTIAVGPPPGDAAECYTAVLRGVIALSRARFPKGVAGRDLDALARQFLWSQGRDYDHGTGHGVGAYLSVHEGPQGFSRRNGVPLEAGMILSNEPGYYRIGAFGIRIENLMVVRDAPDVPGGDARKMLDFETLTHVPLDRRLIRTPDLAPGEKDWIDRYHADTLTLVGPRVDGAALDWLKAACAPL